MQAVIEEIPRKSGLNSADDLRDMSKDELLTLFKAGGSPSTLEPIEGDPRGLGIGMHVRAGKWFDRALRKRTVRERFLWHGKSFRMKSLTEGWGFNRMGRGPLIAIFPFRTSLGPSVIDGKPCVIIDYNVPRNPWWERLTYDELRDLGDGVYLGITTIRFFGRRPIVLWFAIDTLAERNWVGA